MSARLPARMAIQPPEASVKELDPSNHLKPGGFLGKLCLPTVVLRGIVLNVFFILPVVFIAVFLATGGVTVPHD